MRSIRMIATDLDGTLLDADQHISNLNREALQQCAHQGVHVVLASGRIFEAVRLFAEELGVPCAIISCNGARVDLTQKGNDTLKENVMDPTIAMSLFELVKRLNIYFECYTRGRIYMASGFIKRYHAHAPCVKNLGGLLLEYVDGTERMEREALTCTQKFMLFSDDKRHLARAADSIRQSGLDVDISSSWGNNIEIMKRGINKGQALEELANRHGIARDEIMTFGDQTNDLSLLLASGWPVAMENAEGALKAHARIIAPRHDLSGVAQVVKTYVLNVGDTV